MFSTRLITFFLVLCTMAACAAGKVNILSENPLRKVSLVGLLASNATVLDMFVAILGDGKYEITKHLFLSNVLFDIASIMFVSVIVQALLKIGRNNIVNFFKPALNPK